MDAELKGVVDKYEKDYGKKSGKEILPDPKCNLCYGRGVVRTMMNGKERKLLCRCVRLRTVSSKAPNRS